MKGHQISNLIVDLRGNGGGYLRTAHDMADEFLDRGKLIVYTEGRMEDRKTYNATRAGKLEDVELVILIDEGSASASEILAGAIQDHDRGTIIGRRSFGKGLVQQEVSLGDNSAIRLTIARYYTPTGRCIQKPYGEGVDYQNDYFDRLERGELLSADSIDFPDSLKFVTPGGKVVYGGGGIMPDIFVPIDTTENSEYLSEILYAGLVNEYAFDYVDRNRTMLNAYKNPEKYEKEFVITDSALNTFFDFCADKGVPRDPEGADVSKTEFKYRLKANIARDVWGDEGFYRVILKEDKVVDAAMKFFREKANS
jgi:carboxyl-terminal processing protease